MRKKWRERIAALERERDRLLEAQYRMECKLADLQTLVNEHGEKLADTSLKLSALDYQSTNNGAWMQDGIDSILGYQWPPKRGDGK